MRCHSFFFTRPHVPSGFLQQGWLPGGRGPRQGLLRRQRVPGLCGDHPPLRPPLPTGSRSHLPQPCTLARSDAQEQNITAGETVMNFYSCMCEFCPSGQARAPAHAEPPVPDPDSLSPDPDSDRRGDPPGPRAAARRRRSRMRRSGTASAARPAGRGYTSDSRPASPVRPGRTTQPRARSPQPAAQPAPSPRPPRPPLLPPRPQSPLRPLCPLARRAQHHVLPLPQRHLLRLDSGPVPGGHHRRVPGLRNKKNPGRVRNKTGAGNPAGLEA